MEAVLDELRDELSADSQALVAEEPAIVDLIGDRGGREDARGERDALAFAVEPGLHAEGRVTDREAGPARDLDGHPADEGAEAVAVAEEQGEVEPDLHAVDERDRSVEVRGRDIGDQLGVGAAHFAVGLRGVRAARVVEHEGLVRVVQGQAGADREVAADLGAIHLQVIADARRRCEPVDREASGRDGLGVRGRCRPEDRQKREGASEGKSGKTHGRIIAPRPIQNQR